MFHSPEGVGGGTDDEPEISHGALALEDVGPIEKVSDDPSVEGQPEPEPEEKPVVSGLDPAVVTALAQSFGTEIAKHLPKPPEVVAPQMTEEEAKKALNFWEPDKAWQEKYDNLETREVALKEQRDGMIKYADTIAQHRLAKMQAEFQSQIQPLIQQQQLRDATECQGRFNVKFPQLAKPEVGPLIAAVGDALAKQGKTFSSEDELFTTLASGVESVLKVSNPEFKLDGVTPTSSSKPVVTKKTKSNPNALPSTTTGAAGGAAPRVDKGAEKPRGLVIFDS